MSGSERSPQATGRSRSTRGERTLTAAGAVVVTAWCLWWLDALVNLSLRGAGHLWFQVPFFGADFTTQPDWAVRIWQLGESPYDQNHHVFHYPPLVIHLFRWALHFDNRTALRIWIVALMLLVAVSTWVAWRSRARLGLGRLPFLPSLALVLLSFPVVFTLERSNFDLITLGAILIAMATLRLPGQFGRYAAGAILAIGPWVKIYPGLLGLALLGLRWWRAMAGFVAGGVVIGLLEPTELRKSLIVLQRVIRYYSRAEILAYDYYAPWAHSISVLVRKALMLTQVTLHHDVNQRFPASMAALLLLSPVLYWVTSRIARCRQPDALAFPAMCWFVAAGSFVPEVANDYSLVFLPLAALGAWTPRDGRAATLGLLLSLPALQPLALPVSGFMLLPLKISALLAVAGSIVRRAAELTEPPGAAAATTAA